MFRGPKSLEFRYSNCVGAPWKYGYCVFSLKLLLRDSSMAMSRLHTYCFSKEIHHRIQTCVRKVVCSIFACVTQAFDAIVEAVKCVSVFYQGFISMAHTFAFTTSKVPLQSRTGWSLLAVRPISARQTGNHGQTMLCADLCIFRIRPD